MLFDVVPKNLAMQTPPSEVHFYSLHVCGPTQVGGIDVKTSGWEGDIHYTGKHEVPPDSPDIEVWRWLHQNRNAFPAIIERDQFSGIERVFRGGPPIPNLPPTGFYFVSAAWSGGAVAAKNALEAANLRNPLPRPLHILDTDSSEPSRLFPQLVGLLHGWGELFGFIDGRCDIFLELGKDIEALESRIEFLYREP